MSTTAITTNPFPAISMSPIPEMTEHFPAPHMFPDAPPPSPVLRPQANILVVNSESPQRQSRFNQIVEDERRDFDFMNIPTVKNGEKRCLVMLTTFVVLSIITLIVLLSIYARRMDSGTLVSSIITCSGYALWGIYLCYGKYEHCKKYYGGVL